VADAFALDVDDLATARTLIATLQDELTRVHYEIASLHPGIGSTMRGFRSSS
jgi:hypothetical protein